MTPIERFLSRDYDLSQLTPAGRRTFRKHKRRCELFGAPLARQLKEADWPWPTRPKLKWSDPTQMTYVLGERSWMPRVEGRLLLPKHGFSKPTGNFFIALHHADEKTYWEGMRHDADRFQLVHVRGTLPHVITTLDNDNWQEDWHGT